MLFRYKEVMSTVRLLFFRKAVTDRNLESTVGVNVISARDYASPTGPRILIVALHCIWYALWCSVYLQTFCASESKSRVTSCRLPQDIYARSRPKFDLFCRVNKRLVHSFTFLLWREEEQMFSVPLQCILSSCCVNQYFEKILVINFKQSYEVVTPVKK